MMLVHKPTAIPLSSPVMFSHRRHPSAPVVVQPTRVPGLLSLSKPVRPSPSRQVAVQQRQTPRPAAKATKQPSVVRAQQALTPAAEITDKKSAAAAAPATPSRGRAQAKLVQDKAQEQRSASHSSLRGKNGRQPSPPISQLQQIPSQAEAPIKSTNLFDPFLDNSTRSPTLASHPTGKLARRRQHQSPSPALSKAIPVPSAPRTSNLSRSAPVPGQRPRPLPKRSSTHQDFPICDDLNDMADNEPFAPLTPRRLYDNGPLSAPISARTPGGFPFANLGMGPSPSPKKNRKHIRTPSEGVFHMSSDEEVSSGPGGVVLNPNVQALLGLVRTPAPVFKTSPSPFVTPARAIPLRASRESSPSNGSSTEESLSDIEASEKAGYFASSMFQNSPSPDELPDPLLL